MQKITYTAPNGKIAVFSHTELDAAYVFEKVTGIGAADVDIITAKGIAEDGATIQRIDVKDREITVNVHIKGTDRKSLYERRRKLIETLSIEPTRYGERGVLEYQNDYVHFWIPCVVKKGPEISQRTGRYHNSIQLVFYCESPYFRSLQKSKADMAYVDGSFMFPLNIKKATEDTPGGIQFGARAYQKDIVNKGDAPAPIEVKITAPAKFPKITKTKTGEYIQVQKELEGNQELYINTDKDQFTVELKDGDTIESAIDYLAPGSTPFVLEPGSNHVFYESDENTSKSKVTIWNYSFYRGA